MFIPIVKGYLTIHWLKIINKRLAKLFWCGGSPHTIFTPHKTKHNDTRKNKNESSIK